MVVLSTVRIYHPVVVLLEICVVLRICELIQFCGNEIHIATQEIALHESQLEAYVYLTVMNNSKINVIVFIVATNVILCAFTVIFQTILMNLMWCVICWDNFCQLSLFSVVVLIDWKFKVEILCAVLFEWDLWRNYQSTVSKNWIIIFECSELKAESNYMELTSKENQQFQMQFQIFQGHTLYENKIRCWTEFYYNFQLLEFLLFHSKTKPTFMSAEKFWYYECNYNINLSAN